MSHVHALTNRRWPAETSFPGADDRAAAARTDHAGLPAVLIQVPTVRPARRSSAHATARVRLIRPARPRRRLRREFRRAAWVLLTLAPASLVVARLFGAGAGPAEAQTDLAVARPPMIRLSVEAADPEGAAPVVLPGYLLPDDGTGTEESAHAGG